MKGKRITIYIMEVLAALIGMLSAVGGSCPAFHPERILDVEPGETVSASSQALYDVMMPNQWAFITLNILTYTAAVLTLVMIWGLAKRKKWAYNGALYTAILGCLSGFIPYLIVTLGGASTPSYMRAIVYAIVAILLLMPGFRKAFSGKDDLQKSGVSGEQISAFLIFPGILIWIQSILAAPSHMLGSNVQMHQALQISMAIVLISVGILVYSISKIKKIWK
ncbi:MAG: hypothetical protein DRO88_04710 [Promethearchaeia archaeon]|nr:MAG: hypothetical protein DRO88_04710 [Candidatus Lokiarchaeia archaeon]